VPSVKPVTAMRPLGTSPMEVPERRRLRRIKKLCELLIGIYNMGNDNAKDSNDRSQLASNSHY